MSEFLDYEDIAPELYYAITINSNGVISGRHESKNPITALQFYNNPWLHGDIVRGVYSVSEYIEGVHIDCYDEAGKYKGHVWAIQNGYAEIPAGYEILDGKLIESVPAEGAPLPPSLEERLNNLKLANEQDSKINTLVFRALAQTDVIKPADALDNAGMFPVWIDGIGQRAEPGSYWRHGDKIYRVNAGQGHTIQADWPPNKAASLFSLAANPAEEWPEWIQPTGAHNAYAKGTKVTHNGQRWISDYKANTWVPGVFGWVVQ